MVLQVFLNRVVFGMPLQEAVDAPRLHHQWEPDVLQLEPRGIAADVRSGLERRGHQMRVVDGWMGEVNAAELDPATGRFLGAPDPRGAGRAATW
jgi:gamma-glutamyltranspeptidase/glutathione hydrolase